MNAITRRVIHWIGLAHLTVRHLSRARQLGIVFAGLLFTLVCGLSTVWPQDIRPPWQRGDVFVAVGNGQYKVYRVSESIATLIDTFSDGQPPDSSGNNWTTGCAFDSTNHLYTTNWSNTKVVKFDPAPPHAILQTIDTNATSPGGHSESIVFDQTGNFYVGHADGNHFVHKYNPAGTLLLPTFAPAIDRRGTDWIELAADQKTLFYTSEGRKIKRFDVSTGTQLPDFANLPGVEGPTAFALRLLPPGDGSGGLLVADRVNIKRLDSSGAIVRTYAVEGVNQWFALNLDPNGTSFWAQEDFSGKLYRFNITTGALEVGPVITGGVPDGGGICVFGGFGSAQSSISQPLQGDGVINRFTFTLTDSTGTHTLDAKVTANYPIVDTSMTVTLSPKSQTDYKQMISGSDFDRQHPNSTCIATLGLGQVRNCALLSFSCTVTSTGQPTQCPTGPGTRLDDSYDTNVVQINPAFLHFFDGNVKDQLTAFSRFRDDTDTSDCATDPTAPGCFSDWMAADKGATSFAAFQVPFVVFAPAQNAFATLGTFTTVQPLTLPENVLLQLGSYSTFVSNDLFQPTGRGGFFFAGTIEDINVGVLIQPLGGNRYWFAIGARPVNLNVTPPSATLPLSLTVGDHHGSLPQVPVFFVDRIDD